MLCSWIAAAFLPLCTKSLSDRQAAKASGIAFCMLVFLYGIIAGISRMSHGDSTYYYG
jgi:hypothetical protein